MISVNEAQNIIQNAVKQPSLEKIPFEKSLGRILGEEILADRDFPPFDRVSMDGIAVQFKAEYNTWPIQNIQAAGQKATILENPNAAIEVMTGAVLPENTDTVIKYEDLKIEKGVATFIGQNEIALGQNVHQKGTDITKDNILLQKGKKIGPAEIALMASVGSIEVLVEKRPKIAVIGTGDELVPPHIQPQQHQIRSSNVYAIAALLIKNGFESKVYHLPDNEQIMYQKISELLRDFEFLIFTGGVSMGKYDFLPKTLQQLGAVEQFHKIKQTPGKPLWFGLMPYQNPIFALPGNPVSSFMCTVRYILPFLTNVFEPQKTAILEEDFSIKSSFTYFLQVKTSFQNGAIVAKPLKGNGSGDFANLTQANGFVSLDFGTKTEYKKGEIVPYWPF